MKEPAAGKKDTVRLDLWLHWSLFLGLVALPALLSSVTAGVAFERAKTLEFCGSCHTMDPYVEGLKDPKSELLAAKHYQYRRINHNQCYTCHTDYNFLGPVNAKVRGMRHVVAYYIGGGKKQPQLYAPFKNAQCLQCHDGAKSFERAKSHADVIEQIRSDEMSCITCHGPVHPSHEAKP